MSKPDQLVVRPPTGQPAWPLVLIEGCPKRGKTFEALSFSNHERVHRTFVFDLGDGTADEYADVGDYEIVVTDGTYSNLYASVKLACREQAPDGKWIAVVLDSGSQLWATLKLWTDDRARRSRTGQRLLASDPDAAIDPTSNLWNDAKKRWSDVIETMRLAPVIGIVTVTGRDVTLFEGGQPTQKTTYSLEAEKTLESAVTCQIHVDHPKAPTLVCARSAGGATIGGMALPAGSAVGRAVELMLGDCDQFGQVTARRPDVPELDAPAPAPHTAPPPPSGPPADPETIQGILTRARALPEPLQERLKEWAKDQHCPAFTKLTVDWVAPVDARLTVFESLASSDGGTAPTPEPDAASPPVSVNPEDELRELRREAQRLGVNPLSDRETLLADIAAAGSAPSGPLDATQLSKLPPDRLASIARSMGVTVDPGEGIPSMVAAIVAAAPFE